jgi:cobalt-zinc-cadmium efflux system outer membrane protein
VELETMTTSAIRRGAGASAPARASAAFLIAVLWHAGCASPELGARHRELERSFSAGAPHASSDQADPFAHAPELERERLVQEVLRRNPSLDAARQAWRAALERFPQVISLDDPSAGFGVAPRSIGSSAVRDGYKGELAQRLPFPGKLTLRGEVALASAEAAEYDYQALRRRLAEAASLLFDDYYVVARAIEINDIHTELLGELREAALARYAAGEAAQQDPLQAEVEHAHRLHDGAVLSSELRVTAARIDALLHRRADAPLPPPPPRLDPPASETLDPEMLVERALRERPELRAAEARVRGRRSGVALARREFLPDVTLVGAWEGLMQESQLRPVVGLSIDLPIRIERRRAALAEARAELSGAKSERSALEDEVRFEVTNAVLRSDESRHVLHLLDHRLLPAARDRVAAARAGYETGRNGFDALIEAERELRDAELDRERALADLSRRHAELQRAIGALPGLP